MKKVLFVASVVKTHIMTFHVPYLKWFKEHGFETHVCARNDYDDPTDCVIPFCDKFFDFPFERSPFKIANLMVYKHLKHLIETNKYDIIHCHTPVASVLTRLAARKVRKTGTKVLYTAHGFHFYKGAPLLNWLLYYPVERWMARYTDVLITINQEDYEIAKTFKAGKIEYVPGVGIDTQKFSKVVVDKIAKRKELGVPADAFLLLSVGELNKNKNHETIIKALAKLKNPKIFYLICGRGSYENKLKDLSKKLGLENQVILLGYRSDVAEIYRIVDLFLFPSHREGLPVSLMEAMASGIPIVCSDIRGNKDLINNDYGGYLVKPNDINGFTMAIKRLYQDATLRVEMARYNQEKIWEFDLENIKELTQEIYLNL